MRRTRSRPSQFRFTFLVLVAALAVGTQAGWAGIGIGGRAGASSKPDQFVAGAQARLWTVMPAVEFTPSIDFGFGDNLNTTTFNADFLVNLPSLPKVTPNIYIGGGPTLAQYNPDGGGSNSEFGLSIVGGLRVPMSGLSYYNLEARFGTGDIPDIKVLLGILFGL